MSIETEMAELAAQPATDWHEIVDLVTARVSVVVAGDEQAREPVAAYLRSMEEAARRERVGAATLQVIASARRLLGERPGIERAPAPFLKRLG